MLSQVMGSVQEEIERAADLVPRLGFAEGKNPAEAELGRATLGIKRPRYSGPPAWEGRDRRSKVILARNF